MLKSLSLITIKRMATVGVAFVVFGFIDNAIMVVAGDGLDKTIGAMFGVSTMFSAGIGNTISDAIGILSGRIVEKKLHGVIPKVNESDLSTRQSIFAETLGIVIGCLVGMFPLLIL